MYPKLAVETRPKAAHATAQLGIIAS